jgi:hypothetical protein
MIGRLGTLLCAALLVALLATPAEAGPVGAAIGAIAGTIKAASLAIGIAGRLAIWVAVTALQQARARKAADKARNPAIESTFTSTGGVQPLSFIVGTYATAGHMEAPPMVHGPAERPRSMLNYVISVSDVPGCELSRMWIDGKEWTASTDVAGFYGTTGAGRWYGKAWVRWKNGTQTAADGMLTASYGADPDRPWLSDMIGRGVCHAVLTFKYDRDEFQSLPQVMFEVTGIALYDPRKDSTVGGSGAHRWGNRATYEPSDNPMVIAYNVARGIDIEGAGVWGGGYGADDLPLAWWFAAMNECDVLVDNGAGGTERQYRMGLEVRVDSAPADLIAECAVSCNGRFVEQGGILKPRVGGPGLPVMTITDEDIMVTAAQEDRPFPGYDQIYNAVSASFPDPAQKWAAREGVVIEDAAAEAEDGEQLVADLQYPAVPYQGQVWRLAGAALKDGRRFRAYSGVLPPDALALEPLDAIAFTSPGRGYSAKVFEVQATDEYPTLQMGVSLREMDPDDYIPVAPTLIAAPSVAPQVSTGAVLAGFTAAGTSIADGSGVARRPGILASWTASGFVAGQQVEYVVQTPGGAAVTSGVVPATAGVAVIGAGLVASSAYRVAARIVGVADAVWSAWVAVTTPGNHFDTIDLAANSVSAIRSAFGSTGLVVAPADGWVTVTSLTFTPATADGFLLALVDGATEALSGSGTLSYAQSQLRVRWRGVQLGNIKAGAGDGPISDAPVLDTYFFSVALAAGTGSGVADLQIQNSGTDGVVGGALTLAVTEFKR